MTSLLKLDFDSDQWNRQSHFSFTIDELICFSTCLGLGDKAAVDVAGLSQNMLSGIQSVSRRRFVLFKRQTTQAFCLMICRKGHDCS